MTEEIPQPSELMKAYRFLRKGVPSNYLLFYKVGDFYELFDDEARAVHQVLGVALTKRQNVSMCGIPYHSIPKYTDVLLKARYDVAVFIPKTERGAASLRLFDKDNPEGKAVPVNEYDTAFLRRDMLRFIAVYMVRTQYVSCAPVETAIWLESAGKDRQREMLAEILQCPNTVDAIGAELHEARECFQEYVSPEALPNLKVIPKWAKPVEELTNRWYPAGSSDPSEFVSLEHYSADHGALVCVARIGPGELMASVYLIESQRCRLDQQTDQGLPLRECFWYTGVEPEKVVFDQATAVLTAGMMTAKAAIDGRPQLVVNPSSPKLDKRLMGLTVLAAAQLNVVADKYDF